MMFPKKAKRSENTMSVEEFKALVAACPNAIPKKKWSEPRQSPTRRAEAPEAALQSYTDDLLTLKGYLSLRFPDGFLGWMKCRAPAHIAAIFFRMWGGRADNTFLIPLGDGYHLAVPMELKTQDKKGRAVGRLHGKQKDNARAEGWHIARSTTAIDTVIAKAEVMAEKLKKVIAQP